MAQRAGSRHQPQGAIAACETCGMPVRVVFDDEGKIAEVFAVCGHVKKPESDDG